MSGSRVHIRLAPEHASLLARLAKAHGTTKSKLVDSALLKFVLRPNAARGDSTITARIDELREQLSQIERDQTVLIETLALFIRHHFAITAPVPKSHEDAARAQGRARFDHFLTQLRGQLEGTRRFVKEVKS